ncbi:MAG: hypothetical protein II730_01635, partial [Bacteroidales bacterium]|nr:hypothetical protein [Bacteroidales bacterium]
MKIAKNAVNLAIKMKGMFQAKGYELHMDSPTNQQFIILDDEQMDRISKHALFEIWEPLPDGRTVVRFATSWATTQEDLDFLDKII